MFDIIFNFADIYMNLSLFYKIFCFSGFLNHQQNYVDKLLKEIKHLKEEKQKMSFELFAAKMEVEILKKQQLCIYERGYITGMCSFQPRSFFLISFEFVLIKRIVFV